MHLYRPESWTKYYIPSVSVNIPKIITASSSGNTIIIGGPEVSTADEAQLLQEEQALELADDHVRSHWLILLSAGMLLSSIYQRHGSLLIIESTYL